MSRGDTAAARGEMDYPVDTAIDGRSRQVPNEGDRGCRSVVGRVHG
jgi:hypothetical protein